MIFRVLQSKPYGRPIDCLALFYSLCITIMKCIYITHTNHHYLNQSDNVGTPDSCGCINYNHQIQQKVSNIEVKLPFVHLFFIFLLLFRFIPAILKEES